MVIQSPFYKQLKKEIRVTVAEEAITNINNLVRVVHDLYPDPEFVSQYGVDEVLNQAQVTLGKLKGE
jgi:hypothetical protein